LGWNGGGWTGELNGRKKDDSAQKKNLRRGYHKGDQGEKQESKDAAL